MWNLQVASLGRIIEAMENDFDSDIQEVRDLAIFGQMSDEDKIAFSERMDQISRVPGKLRLGRKEVSRKEFIGVVNHAFDLIGGVPRLALWADANPDKFYNLWAKVNNGPQNKDVAEKIQIELSIGRNSTLDNVTVSSTGQVLDVSDAEVINDVND